MKVGESYCNIICPCGHEADISEFCHTPINGPLPKNHFQCPECSHAWSLQTVGTATRGWSGMIIPPDLKTIPTSPFL